MKGFKNAKIYVEGKGIVETNLSFDNGLIKEISTNAFVDEAIEIPKNATVFPGFIDEHIHGASGSDAMDGTVKDLEIISNSVASEGTVGFLATTMTQSNENILKAMKSVKEFKENQNQDGAECLGIHLEGPFISVKHVGAQPIEYVQNPSVEVFKEYNQASGNNIKIVSLAPECQNADELVKYLSDNDIVASVGHTDATYDVLDKSISLGLKSVTHTYNAQKPLHHREIGTVGTALLRDELNCEMIADTIHVSVPAMRLVIKNKPHDKVTLITDAMRAKNLPDGISELGGQTVYVKNGEARLKDGTLAGSVLKMNIAVKNIATKVGVSVTDAIDFATINPAKNLNVDNLYGSIKEGKKASFVVLDEEFNVLMTIREGKVIYAK